MGEAYDSAVASLTAPVVPVGVDVNELSKDEQRALIRAGMAANRRKRKG